MTNQSRKILFLGETYRADAITWMNGLREFGSFEIITCELQTSSKTFISRAFRFLEYAVLIYKVRQMVKHQKPDIVIAERSTSYGFLASISGAKIIVIAQQGISDLWPENSILYNLKKKLQRFAYKHATLIHAWGNVMVPAMKAANVPDSKILIMPKGINLQRFNFHDTSCDNKIMAIVTRSLYEEYGHSTILKAFQILKNKGIPFELTIVGDGILLESFKTITTAYEIEKKVHFLGEIENQILPRYLSTHNFYLSMPTTEGVSASLFEAMASGCYPIVSDLPGNRHFINHQKNGQLVTVGDAEMLAAEIIWAFENAVYRKNAIIENRIFVENNANYQTNMTIIANRYHQLIDDNLCAE